MPKNLARKASNSKKQTRLTFDPVPQNSPPTTTGMSPANVRYTLPGGRVKRIPATSLRNAAGGSESDDVLSSATMDAEGNTSAMCITTRILPFKGMPTPAKSSQPQFNFGFLDDSQASSMVAQNKTIPSDRSSIRKKQTGFLRGSEAYKRPPLNDAESSEGSEPEERNITPSKRVTKRKHKLEEVKSTVISSDSDSPEDFPAVAKKSESASKTPLRRSARKGPAKPEPITLSDSDDDLALPRLSTSLTRSGPFKSNKLFQSSLPSELGKLDNDSDEDDDPVVSSPKRSQRPPFRRKTLPDSESDSEEQEKDEQAIKSFSKRIISPSVETGLNDDNDDEEQTEVISPLKRRRPIVESESDSDIVESPSKRQRNMNPAILSEASDSDYDVLSLSKTHRRVPVVKSESPPRFTRQARIRRHRSVQEKTLELIKRKRAGEKISKLTDTEPSDSEDEEDGPAFEELSEFEDDDEEEEEKTTQSRQKIAKKTSTSNEDINDDNFIVEDDENDPLGVPPMHSIPLEFTHQAHKPLKEHFRDAIEWMVHSKMNPAFARDDPVYDQAFRKLETECSGLAKSKFSSTQWTRDFTAALYSRPIFLSGELEDGEGIDLASGRPKCDACNHRSHIPSKFIQFQGKAYSKRTLEELDQDSDSDSDDGDSNDSDRIEVNEQGQELAPEKTKWFVGRHCFANAEQSHTLLHWKFALYEWVKDTLESEGELLPAKLAEREKMKAKQRTAYANALVDRWAEENQIRDLYRDFKNQVSTARDLQQGKRGAWI